jgi:hypothetical protein
MSICKPTLFGPSSQYIKVGNGEFLSIEGSITGERLILSDLRIPYKQILKSKVILKPGQVNYLLNFLGLGDNATFLTIKANYDPKAVIESDRYVNWSFYDELTKIYSFAQMMVLTGNSTNRVKQLYLTNPSSKYSVILEVMVGVMDDNYSFFNDSINQSGTSFINLQYTDIKTHIVGESIVIFDSNSNPLIYLILNNIQEIKRSGDIIILDDSSIGSIFLQFKTSFDVDQAFSLLMYVLENKSVNIDTLLYTPSQLIDIEPPIIYFYENIGNTQSGDWISFNGSTASVPYNTSNGLTFSTSTTYTGLITKNVLIDLLIDYVEDNRDGLIEINSDNLIIISESGTTINQITATGSYQIKFNLSDLANNKVDINTVVNIEFI